MDGFSIFSFMRTIFNTLYSGAKALYNTLNVRIPLSGLVSVISKVINFFGGTTPQAIQDLANYDLSLMSIGGVLLASIIVLVVIKKIVPMA